MIYKKNIKVSWWLHVHKRTNAPAVCKNCEVSRMSGFSTAETCSRPTYNRKHERAFGKDDGSRSAVLCGHKGYSLDWRDTVLLLRRMDWHFRPLWPQGFFAPVTLSTKLLIYHASLDSRKLLRSSSISIKNYLESTKVLTRHEKFN